MSKNHKTMPQIIEINKNNLSDYPQVICFINPEHKHYSLKIDWMKKRFKEGLKIKLLQTENDQKIVGFIEYIPGDYTWRAVNAKTYLFIHCLWVYPNKHKSKGLGSVLVEEVVADAKKQKMNGVAVVTSDGSFMAKKDLFIKNSFELIEEKDGFQLLAQGFNKKTAKPYFINNEKAFKKYHGWHIIYSKQCPWVARFIEEVKPIIEKQSLKITFHEITSAKAAQSAPSIYAVFNLIKDGRLLADRYISTTRFLNIIKKIRSIN